MSGHFAERGWVTGTPTSVLRDRPARGPEERRAELQLLRADPERYFALPPKRAAS